MIAEVDEEKVKEIVKAELKSRFKSVKNEFDKMLTKKLEISSELMAENFKSYTEGEVKPLRRDMNKYIKHHHETTSDIQQRLEKVEKVSESSKM